MRTKELPIYSGNRVLTTLVIWRTSTYQVMVRDLLDHQVLSELSKSSLSVGINTLTIIKTQSREWHLYTDKTMEEEVQLEETSPVPSMLNYISYRATSVWVAALAVSQVLIKDKYTPSKANRLTKVQVHTCSTPGIFRTSTEDKKSIIATTVDYPSWLVSRISVTLQTR